MLWTTGASYYRKFTIVNNRTTFELPPYQHYTYAVFGIWSVQSNLTKGLIAGLSPLAAANVLVPPRVLNRCIRPRRQANTAQCIDAYVRYNGQTRVPSKLSLPMGWFGPHLIGLMVSSNTAPKTASRSVQPFLCSSPVWPTHKQADKETKKHAHRHADHATCDICSNRSHLYTARSQCSIITRRAQ